jgi:hypothetical protein
VSVAEFVTGVDRLLTRAHGLFPAGGGDAGGVFAAGCGDSVPAPPAGASGLDVGAGAARGFYQHAHDDARNFCSASFGTVKPSRAGFLA